MTPSDLGFKVGQFVVDPKCKEIGRITYIDYLNGIVEVEWPNGPEVYREMWKEDLDILCVGSDF